jgi:thiamine-monophosphate kinase
MATAAIDVSDGLVADVGHLARSVRGMHVEIRASGCAAVCREPQRRLARDRPSVRDLLSGGDDYEIAFTAPPAARARIQAPGHRRLGVAPARIGSCRKGARRCGGSCGRRQSCRVSTGRALRIFKQPMRERVLSLAA